MNSSDRTDSDEKTRLIILEEYREINRGASSGKTTIPAIQFFGLRWSFPLGLLDFLPPPQLSENRFAFAHQWSK